MLELLQRLCGTDGASGDEGAVRDIIISKIDGKCDWRIDNLGNIIAFKKGKKPAVRRVLVDAHTDEVGLIITHITSDGFLKFQAVGGIDTAVMLCRRVKINGKINGVIGSKPIHLTHGEEGKKLPKASSLYIDIGAKSREEASALVSLGDRAVMCGEYTLSGDKVCSKALDDRIGCAVLAELLCRDAEYDFYASFSVQEEVGLRGATAAAFSVKPQSAIIIEGTTAADVAEVPEERRVCALGKGAAVSFMDRSTVYDRAYYNAALSSGIPCQPKAAVAGGNNAGAVHLCAEGVRTVAISAPCRYIHSAASVADLNDIKAVASLTEYMLNGICGGTIE